jgi:rod shape-determining protein MreC
VFLPGLLVGYASDITNDSNNVTKSGYLVPAAEFDSLQDVLVVTKLKSDMMKEEASKETSPAETQATEDASQ